MKKKLMVLFVVLFTFLFVCVNVNAFSIQPPYGSVKVSRIQDTAYHSLLGDAKRINYYSEGEPNKLGYKKVLCIYSFDKTVSLPVGIFGTRYRCSQGQTLSHSVTYRKESSTSITWEERTSNSISASTNMNMSAVISVPIIGINASQGFSQEFSTTVSKEFATGTTCTETIGNGTTVEYNVTEPGYYLAQQRYAFECYWIKEYIIIYDVVGGIQLQNETIYLTNHYLKIKQIPNDTEYGFYKYNLRSDGKTFEVDQSKFNDAPYRIYL